MLKRLDALGAAMYPKALVDGLLPGMIVGLFYEEFGNSLSTGRRVLRSGKCPGLVYQVLWDKTHKYAGNSEKKLFAALPRIFQQARNFPDKEFWVSPFCEHAFKRPYMEGIFKKIRQMGLPNNVTLVNTPWIQGGGQFIPGEVNEIHRMFEPIPPGAYIFSGDGAGGGGGGAGMVDLDMYEVHRKHSNAFMLGVWSLRMNLGEVKQKKFIEPKKRRAKPSAAMVRATCYLAVPPPTPVNVPSGLTKLTSKDIWKAFAEDLPNANEGKPELPRENRPVLITPHVGPRAEVFALNGKRIAVSEPQRKFEDGRARYDFTKLYGFQMAEAAVKASGQPWVFVKVGSKRLGPLYPAWREGAHRKDTP